MRIWFFPSENIRNIQIGFEARMWAVSEIDDATMRQRYTKSRDMQPGSFGLLYCSEDHAFTMPFEVVTQPIFKTISGVWPEPWGLPFHIKPLGGPARTLHKDVAIRSWHCLRDTTNPTFKLNGMNGRTIFLPTEMPDLDWAMIIRDIGFREEAANNALQATAATPRR